MAARKGEGKFCHGERTDVIAARHPAALCRCTRYSVLDLPRTASFQAPPINCPQKPQKAKISLRFGKVPSKSQSKANQVAVEIPMSISYRYAVSNCCKGVGVINVHVQTEWLWLSVAVSCLDQPLALCSSFFLSLHHSCFQFPFRITSGSSSNISFDFVYKGKEQRLCSKTAQGESPLTW